MQPEESGVMNDKQRNQRTIKTGLNTSPQHQQVSWLEDRVERETHRNPFSFGMVHYTGIPMGLEMVLRSQGKLQMSNSGGNLRNLVPISVV